LDSKTHGTTGDYDYDGDIIVTPPSPGSPSGNPTPFNSGPATIASHRAAPERVVAPARRFAASLRPGQCHPFPRRRALRPAVEVEGGNKLMWRQVCAKGLLMNNEQQRLDEARNPNTPWKKWGPYLSERQWGTVREDYSESGNAWDYFTHDQARSRAYHWGEDGLAGISDDKQRLCFALALGTARTPS
jgi:hypothetical protein